MENISNVNLCPMGDSMYIKPLRMNYEQDGKKKFWDLLKIHDSVAVLLFNTTRQVLIFVKQFRPTVYLEQSVCDEASKTIDSQKYPAKLGITMELCAGIVDKDQTLAETARDEVLEECGYDVPLTGIKKVTSYRSNVGISASLQVLFYAEVTDDMKVSKGGGKMSEGEMIDVVELTVNEAKALVFDESIARPVSLMFGLMWFFQQNKVPSQ